MRRIYKESGNTSKIQFIYCGTKSQIISLYGHRIIEKPTTCRQRWFHTKICPHKKAILSSVSPSSTAAGFLSELLEIQERHTLNMQQKQLLSLLLLFLLLLGGIHAWRLSTCRITAGQEVWSPWHQVYNRTGYYREPQGGTTAEPAPAERNQWGDLLHGLSSNGFTGVQWKVTFTLI